MKKLRKDIFVIAFPIIIQSLTEFILRFTDMAFIGHYNPRGLSAINNAIFPYFMFLAFFFALSKGTTILITQNIGAKRESHSRRFAEVSFLFNVVIALIYFVFWIVMTDKILYLIGARDDILRMGVSYLHISIFHLLFFGIVLSVRSIFEGIGDTKPILIATLITSSINIVLDPLLIFGKFGLPRLGIRGAALATLISQFIGMWILLILLFKHKTFKISIGGIFRINFKLYYKSFKLGLPSGIEFMLWTAGQNLILFMLNTINDMWVGIMGIFNLLMGISLYIYFGISIASLNLVGKAIGAKDWERGLIIGNTSLIYSFIICLASAILFFIFPKQILSIFTTNKEIINNNYFIMFIIAFIIFPKAANVVGGNSIRGTGNTKWMLYTQIIGTVTLVVGVYVVLFILKMGLIGLFIAIFIDEFWRSIINYFKFRKIIRVNHVKVLL